MANFALLVVCFALGIVLRRAGRLPETAPATLNALIINVALPALILLHLHQIPITPSLAQAVMGAWLAQLAQLEPRFEIFVRLA